MIQFKDVYTIYDDEVEVLNGINLEIKDGEFVCIVGPSGAGKSTLLRLLTHELLPNKGEVILDGVSLSELPSKAIPLLRRKIGTVYQDFKLLSAKTAFENVAFALEVCGVSRRRIRDVVPQVLDVVGLHEKGDRYPRQLSGGEQQRISIARALVHGPKILVADEPTGNLDALNTREIIDILQHINEFGTTVILVTHNRDVVNMLKRRVVTLESGKVVADHEEGKYRL